MAELFNIDTKKKLDLEGIDKLKKGPIESFKETYTRNKYKKMIYGIKDMYKKLKGRIDYATTQLIQKNQDEHKKDGDVMLAKQQKEMESWFDKHLELAKEMNHIKIEVQKLGDKHSREAIELDMKFLKTEMEILKKISSS